MKLWNPSKNAVFEKSAFLWRARTYDRILNARAHAPSCATSKVREILLKGKTGIAEHSLTQPRPAQASPGQP